MTKIKEQLKEALLEAMEIDPNYRDENISWAIQDYYGSTEFDKESFKIVYDITKYDKQDIFDVIADDDQLYSEDWEGYLEFFKENGYLKD